MLLHPVSFTATVGDTLKQGLLKILKTEKGKAWAIKPQDKLVQADEKTCIAFNSSLLLPLFPPSHTLPHFFPFLFFRATLAAYGSSPSCIFLPTPEQLQIWATSATYTAACSNARSLTHWVKPGIKPASSWTLCWVLNLLSHNRNSMGIPYT